MKIWDFLRLRSKKKTLRAVRPAIEMLEDRAVPTATGYIGGSVSLDSTNLGVQGVSVSIVGTSAGNSSVSETTATDNAGAYSFRSLLPGSYHLTTGPVVALLNSGQTIQADVAITDGQAINNENFSFTGGLSPQSIGVGMFLTISPTTEFQAGTPGGSANHAPVVSKVLGTLSLPQGTTNKSVDLAGFFTDPDFTSSQVRLNLSVNGAAQSMLVNLSDATTPQTVANFFDYINAGDYNNAFFNRETNTTADQLAVLQGGGVTVNNTGTDFSLVPVGPSIPNEFGASNVADTIAMAQTSGDPNSANNQFFFNTANNSTQLDPQKFTVFGTVDPSSQSVLTSLAATPAHNLTNATLTHNFPPAGFAEVPLNNYTGSAATFPGDATLNNYLVITSIDVLKRDEFLTYSIVGNNNPGVVTASLTKEFLSLNAVAGQTGSASITVRATDRSGAFVDQTLTVHITAAPAVTSAPITPSQPTATATLTANPVATPVNAGDTVTFTYQWLQNGFPLASQTSQTLNLTALSNVQTGDQFTVKVTPSELVGATQTVGATFTSSPVTIDRAPSITSSANTQFGLGASNTFSVTTTGSPTSAISESGALPSGVTFVDNGDGTATLAGTPNAGTAGNFNFTITATNGASPDATQNFTLEVTQTPAITSADNTLFQVGSNGTFSVLTTGFPINAITENGALPGGVNFLDNGDGTATLSGTPNAGTAGIYPLTITAANGVTPNANQSFTLTVQ